MRTSIIGIMKSEYWKQRNPRASLTVEAALVLPLFLYFMLAFLYFIQIFTIQEQIQAAITKMGLSLSKTAYILKDFPKGEDILNFDFSIFGKEYELGLGNVVEEAASENILKQYATKYLDTEQMDRSCIVGGYDGISFDGSSIYGDDYIDIIIQYKTKIPVHIFFIHEMQMIQRVKLRAWTGMEVSPAYETDENISEMVFVTETGSVYHKTASCTHIKLSVTAVQGIPNGMTNEYGAKYKPCEACCAEPQDGLATYYITSDGTRYHTTRTCSKIKRTVREILLSEVGARTPCKRCYK